MAAVPRTLSAAALASLLLLAGCTSTPASEPGSSTSPSGSFSPSATASPSSGATAPPDLSTLTLTTEGLGTLVIGSPVPDQESPASIVVWDEQYCEDLPTPGGNYAGAFIPVYPKVDSPPLGEREVFVVVTSEGNDTSPVSSVRVLTPDVLTAEGVGVGSTRAELLEAYPSFDGTTTEQLSDTYSITGEAGQLVFEVAKNSTAPVEDYWEDDLVDTVLWMTVLPVDTPVHALAGGDGGGPCVV